MLVSVALYPQAPPAERTHNLLPPDPCVTGGSSMAPRHPNHPLIRPAIGDKAKIQQQLLEAVESIWQTVHASRRCMEDAREAIARADKALARRILRSTLATAGVQICLGLFKVAYVS